MKIATMISDISLSLFQRPVTEKYPQECYPAPERLRGHLRWDSQKCTGCGLCVMDCPAYAIEMIVIDKKNKRFVMRYQVDRCTFCAQCVFSCRQGCLEMSHDIWELAALNREAFGLYFGEKDDIEYVLAESTERDT